MGEQAMLYSDASEGNPVARDFTSQAREDRHQFRLVVATDDAAEYESLQPLIRRLIRQVSDDLHTGFDWVAADHFDTGRPHSHVVMRGRDRAGDDLIIASEYLRHGFVSRAGELVSLDLGPPSLDRSPSRRELEAERMTPLDRRLLRDAGESSALVIRHSDVAEACQTTARLRWLAEIGLAAEESPRHWWLDRGLESKLSRIAERNRAATSVVVAVRDHHLARCPVDLTCKPVMSERPEGIVGRLVVFQPARSSSGLELVIDGLDGRVRLIEADTDGQMFKPGMIVRVTPAPAVSPGVDRSITYDLGVPDLSSTRHPGGQWGRSPEAAAHGSDAYMTAAGATVAILSPHPLTRLPDQDAINWLDCLLVGGIPTLGHGFGHEVRSALIQRLSWLESHQLAQRNKRSYDLSPILIDRVRAVDRKHSIKIDSRYLTRRQSLEL